MNINIVAKTTFAIIAVVALVAMIGAVSTGAGELLNAAMTIVAMLIVGGVIIALLVHLPRFR